VAAPLFTDGTQRGQLRVAVLGLIAQEQVGFIDQQQDPPPLGAG